MDEGLPTLFATVIRTTRYQALSDGTLVDLSEWSNEATGFTGGFIIPVAVTKAVWDHINDIPGWAAWQDVRGRAHDLLWMACSAAKSQRNGYQTVFELVLPLSTDPHTDDSEIGCGRRHYKLVYGPDDDGSPCITIMLPDED